MKKLGIMLSALGAVALAAPSLRAATVATSTAAVTATVTSVSGMTVQFKNISDDANAGSVSFGSQSSGQGAWSTLPAQYAQIAVNDNAPSWRLRTYTDNFASQPSTTSYGFSYGALISPAPAKAPLAWLTNPTVIPSGPGVGSPSSGTVNGWTYIKDLKDVDDPATAGNNESFTTADTGGYTNIAFGAPSFTRIVRPNVTGGSDPLATNSSPFFYYVEGDFSTVAGGSYTAKLVLELIEG